jgi:hypothetical protein
MHQIYDYFENDENLHSLTFNFQCGCWLRYVRGGGNDCYYCPTHRVQSPTLEPFFKLLVEFDGNPKRD